MKSINMGKGFTLIELLVVISIIAMLSSIVLASLKSARAKAIVASQKVGLHEVKNALALYANNHNGNYPATTTDLVLQGYIKAVDPSIKYEPFQTDGSVCLNYPCATYIADITGGGGGDGGVGLTLPGPVCSGELNSYFRSYPAACAGFGNSSDCGIYSSAGCSWDSDVDYCGGSFSCSTIETNESACTQVGCTWQ